MYVYGMLPKKNRFISAGTMLQNKQSLHNITAAVKALYLIKRAKKANLVQFLLVLYLGK
jgi:hypothetical protein